MRVILDKCNNGKVVQVGDYVRHAVTYASATAWSSQLSIGRGTFGKSGTMLMLFKDRSISGKIKYAD